MQAGRSGRSPRALQATQFARPMCLAAVVVAVAVLTSASHVTTAEAAPPINDCADLLLVFAQGSGQNPDTGNARETGSFFSEIRRLTPPGLDITEYRLGESGGYGGSDYPAISVWGRIWGWPIGDAYFDSMFEGVNELTSFLIARHLACRDETWILGGYSQGGQVVTTALNHLPSAVLDQVGYAATFGDPTLEAGQPGFFSCRRNWYTRGSVNCYQSGALWSFGAPPEAIRGRYGSWCSKFDLVCSGFPDLTWSAHKNYPDGSTAEAALEALSVVRLETGWGIENPDLRDVDLMIAMDTTGSMTETIDGAKDAALEIADQITSNGGRIGLVQFRDAGDLPDVRLEVPLTGDSAAFETAVDGLYADGGGDWEEAQLAGISTALEGSSDGHDWRSGATKLVLVFTDAPGKDPDSILGLTREDVVARSLELDPVSLTGVDVCGCPEVAGWMQPLADGTGGAVISGAPDVPAAFQETLDRAATRPVVVAPSEAYGNLGAPITLTAEGSFDPDSTISSYRWDLDGDGAFERETTEPLVEQTYDTVGGHNVGIVAVSEDGGVGAGSTTVHVYDNWAPHFDPGVPTSVAATQSGADAVTVTWRAPSGAMVAPDGYVVSSTDGAVTARVGADERSVALTHLSVGHEYVFEVRAVANGFYGQPASAPPITLSQPPATQQPSDATGPRITLRGRKTQRFRNALRVQVGCDEQCSVSSRGTVSARRPHGARSRPKRRARYKLKADSAVIPAGGTATLKLRIPERARHALLTTLKAGAKPRGKVKATATDRAGNSSGAALTIMLKR